MRQRRRRRRRLDVCRVLVLNTPLPDATVAVAIAVLQPINPPNAPGHERGAGRARADRQAQGHDDYGGE